MKIPAEDFTKLRSFLQSLRQDRLPWWNHWRDLADYYLPKRYNWLLSDLERIQRASKNSKIIDNTGLQAARVLAAGMMNGITSPARPWFKLRIAGFEDELELSSRIWLDEVERRMLLVLAESNFYNSIAILFLDLVIFGTSAMLVYEDDESVIRCYNCALGEYYLGQSDRLEINIFAREFCYKVHQVVDRWGLDNCSQTVKDAYNRGGAGRNQDVKITHLILPNRGEVAKQFKYCEYYWETGNNEELVLSKAGFFEMPGVFPRWELTGNDSYGTSPAMDALGDVIQLQHEQLRKGQSLDYMNQPPKIADVQLKGKPSAFLPGQTTYVSGMVSGNVGVKPIYQFTPPIAELAMDIKDVQVRIRETFHNDLFKMISSLDTVRSATEIDARREEKLVMLASVLERVKNEALDKVLNRTFAAMERSGLIPEAPATIADQQLEIQYVSILSSAQSAISAIPTERLLGLVGNLAGVKPEVLLIPNFEELIRDYSRDIGVKAKGLRSRKEVADDLAALSQKQQAAEGLAAGTSLAQGAETLSKTQVGGGANALQMMLGG